MLSGTGKKGADSLSSALKNVHVQCRISNTMDCCLKRHGKPGGIKLNEKTYKTIAGVGAGNIVLGIIVIVTGVAAGVLMIVNGGRLLKEKSKVLF